MKKTVSLVLVCVLCLCLLLSGCSLLGTRIPFPSGSGNDDRNNSNNNNSSAGSNSGSGSTGGFSVDLSRGEYSEGNEDGYLGDVLHTCWFNFAAESAYTCKSYGGYTAPDGWLLLVVRMGIKNTFGRSVDMLDDDFLLWWNDDADDAYAWPITTAADYDDDQVHVDSPLSDEMFPATYVLGINETRVGELIFQVPALDADGRENRDFVLNFVEVFDTDNEDERIGDSYYIDFTAESRSPVTPSAQPSPEPSAQPSAGPSPEPSAQPSASGEDNNSGVKTIYASDGSLDWVRLHTGSYTQGEDVSAGMDEVLSTYWFNFLVDEAYTCASYGDYTAPEGQQLLVVHIFLLNTTENSVPMFDDDFSVYWTNTEEDGVSYPLSTGEEYAVRPHIDALLSELQLPEYYEIPVSAAVEGEMIFQIPTDYDEEIGLFLYFEEYFDNNNGTRGDAYDVLLDAEAR